MKMARRTVQSGFFFFGLEPNKDQVVVINAGTGTLIMSAIEVGFATPISQVAVSNDDIQLSAGTALVRGGTVSVADQTLTFTDASGYGRTDILAIDTGGTLSILEGAEPAMTFAKAGVTISEGDTTLEVRNSYFFPSKGFIYVQTPWGDGVICSYSGKSEAAPQSHQLTGVLWRGSVPDVTPLTNFASGTPGNLVGDVTINLLADSSNSVTIDSSNNKIDFKVKLDTDVSAGTFAATIASGVYSADLVPLGNAIEEALQAAKALPDKGSYFCTYSEETNKWSIGVKGTATVEEFELLFSTGVNVANSVHTDIGFGTADQTGELSYVGSTSVFHKAVRCFDRGPFRTSSDNDVKFNYAKDSSGNIVTGEQSVEDRLGLLDTSSVTKDNAVVRVFTSPEACGLEFTIIQHFEGAHIAVQIDEGDVFYPIQGQDNNQSQNGVGRVISTFISFPRGSHSVTIRQEVDTSFELSARTQRFSFCGYRELFTHAPLEKLTTSQSAIKFFEIRPLPLYQENYAYDYVVQSNAFEKIDTITFSGTWAAVGSDGFAANYQNTTTLNDFVDVTFTLAGSGGGISFYTQGGTTTPSNKIGCYIASGGTGTSAAANLIDVLSWDFSPGVGAFDWQPFTITGLAAGQYTMRLRNEDSGNGFTVSGFGIIDTVESDPDAVNHTEVTNADRGISYPITVKKYPIIRNALDRVKSSRENTFFRAGKPVVDYQVNTHTSWENTDEDNNAAAGNGAAFFSAITFNNTQGEYVGVFDHCESVYLMTQSHSSNSQTVDIEIDGRADSSFSDRIAIKSGPTVTNAFLPAVKKNFFRFASGNMSSSTVIPMNDTRGMRVGQSIEVKADGQADEIRRISSITTDTDITINRAISGFASYTTANNLRVRFPGFHRLKVTTDDGTTPRFQACHFGILPMPVTEMKRPLYFDSNVGEVASVIVQGVVDGDSLPIPMYKDGLLASFSECSFSVIEKDATQGYDFINGFQDVFVSAGNIGVKVTAIRKRE